MADESDINLFDYKTPLPVFPNIFFKVIFYCNGIRYQSDEVNNTTDVLDWVNDNLSLFGTWSISSDTLYLIGCIYANVSLGTQQFTSAEGNDLVIYIDNSAPQTIQDILGCSFVDVSVNSKRVGNSVWINSFAAIDFKYGDQFADATTQWYHVVPDTDGYNILNAEAIARGKTLATVLDGVGNKTYGYSFFTDEYSKYITSIGISQSVLSLNICSLLIQVIGTNPVNVGGINFTAFYAEIEYYISTLLANSVTVRRFQLCTEMGINNQSDIIHSAADYKNVCVPIITYLRANYPTIPISSDAYEVDATHNNLSGYNSTINTLNIDGARQYYQFDSDLDTYQKNRDRIAELDTVLSKFTQQFTGGKKCIFQQEVTQINNPFRFKVGEGLIFTEFCINVIKQNITRSNLITDLTFYNANHLLTSNSSNTIYPLYYFMLLIRGAFVNDGMIDFTLDNTDIVVLAVKKGTGAQLFMLNPTADFVTIDATKLNGTTKNITVESYYGNPTDGTAQHYTDSGTVALLYPYSLTKIITI